MARYSVIIPILSNKERIIYFILLFLILLLGFCCTIFGANMHIWILLGFGITLLIISFIMFSIILLIKYQEDKISTEYTVSV